MSNEEGKKIVFGDKEYEVDKLSDQAKMIVSELEFLNPQLEKTNQMLVELQGAFQHLSNRLGTEIGHINDNETDNNEPEDSGD